MLFFQNLIVRDVTNPDWPGHEAGLQIGDQLIAVDDIQVTTSRDLMLVLRDKQVNDTVTVTVDHPSTHPNPGLSTTNITLIQFSLQDLLIFFWLPYTIGLVYLVLGIIVYRLRGSSHGGDVFVAFCVFCKYFNRRYF